MVSHFYYANSDKFATTILIRAMKKYGLNNFSLGMTKIEYYNLYHVMKLKINKLAPTNLSICWELSQGLSTKSLDGILSISRQSAGNQNNCYYE
jgi:hypothetical protein